MSVFIDTVRALSDRYPEAIGLWVFFGLLPIATCAFWTLRYRHQLTRLWPAFHHAAASALGYPTMLVVLLILPVSVFSIFVAPALLDAYPTWRPILHALLAVPNWFAHQAFWVIPVSWLIWALVAPAAIIRRQVRGASA
jgi:type II secretory pathway component PulF